MGEEGDGEHDQVDEEKCGSRKGCDDAAEEKRVEDEKRADGDGRCEDEKETRDRVTTVTVRERVDLGTTTDADADLGAGVVDSILTILVRVVLASVWIAVALGWVLERIADVLALVIELGLVWVPHGDGRL